MELKAFFEERQRFRHPLIYIILFIILGIAIWGLVQQLIYNIPFGNNPVGNTGLIIFTMLPVVFIIFIFSMEQRTRIDSRFVEVSISLFGRRKISWENVENAYIREYLPLAEYGGWGLRFKLGKRDMAFNLGGGKIGLQLVLKDGGKVLIGTQKQEELKAFLSREGKLGTGG